MTIIKNLSDYDHVIYEVILIILKNQGHMDMAKLQWELLKCGVYIRQPKLKEALKEMYEKKLIGKPQEKTPSIIQP